MATPVRECSVANALEVIGERWSLLALREVFFGVRRFDQIQRNTGASRDVLATRLRTLVEAGVLERVPYEQHPPRSEYVLTQAGRDLQAVVIALMHWGDQHVTQGTPPTVLRHACGAVLVPRTVCAHCGDEVRAGESTLVQTRWRERADAR
jgi:DNA-binding HxlR family transcriptional regulator